MGKDDRLVELMVDMLHELRELRTDLSGYQKRTDDRLDKIELNLEKLNDQQVKTNLAIGELRFSVMKLSEQIADFAKHEERLRKLEQTVFRQAS